MVEISNISKAKKGDAHYVKNVEFYAQICAWYKSENTKIPDKIVNAIMQICERLSRRYNFGNYTFREDMVSAAVMACYLALEKKKFKVDRSDNPFAYFTRIAYNEMVRMIKEEKTHSYIKHKSLENHNIEMTLAGETPEGSSRDDFDKNADLIQFFEGKKSAAPLSDEVGLEEEDNDTEQSSSSADDL